MKTKLFSLLFVLLASAGTIYADKVQIGELYYNLDSINGTAEVTYQSWWKSSSPNYSGLITATIPSSVTYNTKNYTVTSIGKYAFEKCLEMTSVSIPNSVTTIRDYAFFDCVSLTSVAIPNSVTSMGESIFSGCTSLTSFDIPNTFTTIETRTFLGCTGLTSVTIPNSITTIGLAAFASCTNMTSIVIPNSVTSIEQSAFSGCIGLTSIDIPNSVKTIGEYAFSECRSMLYTNIPNTVDSIGEKAFYRVPNIYYDGSTPGLPWGARCVNGYVDGLLVYSDSSKLCLKGCSAAAQGELVLPDGIVEIGNYAFWKCYGLTNIVLPEGIIEIGNSAFQFCEGLTNLVLPNTLMRIDTGAISVCSKLTSIAIPENVTSIGAWAFGNDTALSNVTISSSVSTIEEEAFDRCNHLTNVTNYALTPQNADSVFVISRIQLPYLKLDLSNCTLHVPQESIELYKAANGWKEFGQIVPISAEKTETDTVTVETTESSAEIVWPQITGAYTYELIIRDVQGNIVCTLIFDAEGRLISLSFNAPARDNTPQQTQVAGFAFTVTSLNVGTTYSYTITAKDESGTTLNVETGSFTTKNPQAIESVSAIHGESTKFLRDGQILILRGDKTYTLTGQEVK